MLFLNAAAEEHLIVMPERRPRIDALMLMAFGLGASGMLIYWDGVRLEDWFIPPTYGWFGLLCFGWPFLRGVVYGIRPRPTLVARPGGVTVHRALIGKLGPIAWQEIHAFRAVSVGDSDEMRLSIDLKDAATTYKRLGQTWIGLLQWLGTLGDPLRLNEDEIDRPVNDLVAVLSRRLTEYSVK
ncbi:MAG: hypothetical protein AB8B85_21115 [Paracoccaceae bacterium]